MLTLLTANFITSVGAWALWILLGPTYVHIVGSVAMFGVLGLVRQVSSVLGALMIGSWADEGRVLTRHIWTVTAEATVSGMLAITLIFTPTHTLIWQFFLFWALLRFLTSGMSSVFSFKVFSLRTQTLGGASILHLIGVQGSALLGPICALLLTRFCRAPFAAGLWFDALTSLFYLGVLLRFRGTKFDAKFESVKRNILFRIKDAVVCYWDKHVFPWNIFQILVLSATTGFAVWTFNISRVLGHGDASFWYPILTGISGVCLFLGAGVVRYRKPTWITPVGGGLILILSGVLSRLGVDWALFASHFLYTFSFWILLHLSNGKVLEARGTFDSARMRASMMLYLAVIFGGGEVLFGSSVERGFVFQLVSWIRVVGGLVVALLGWHWLRE